MIWFFAFVYAIGLFLWWMLKAIVYVVVACVLFVIVIGRVCRWRWRRRQAGITCSDELHLARRQLTTGLADAKRTLTRLR